MPLRIYVSENQDLSIRISGQDASNSRPLAEFVWSSKTGIYPAPSVEYVSPTLPMDYMTMMGWVAAYAAILSEHDSQSSMPVHRYEPVVAWNFDSTVTG